MPEDEQLHTATVSRHNAADDCWHICLIQRGMCTAMLSCISQHVKAAEATAGAVSEPHQQLRLAA